MCYYYQILFALVSDFLYVFVVYRVALTPNSICKYILKFIKTTSCYTRNSEENWDKPRCLNLLPPF